MESVRASAAPWAPALPSSSITRTSPFTSFHPAAFYNSNNNNPLPDDELARKFNSSPNVERRSFDQHGPTDRDAGSPDGTDRNTPTASVLLLRKLSASMSQEALNSMLIFASDLIDAQFVSSQQFGNDRGYQAAIARFSTQDGALEVRNRLNGKPNASGDASMVVEIVKGANSVGIADAQRRTSDTQPTARHLSTSASSAGSSNGPGRSSRFSSTFQSMDQHSPKRVSRGPGHLDLTGTHFINPQAHGMFPPTSPMRLSNGDRQRISGKALIGEDDDETHDLLYDPLSFAENDQRNRNARGAGVLAQLNNLRLDTNEHPSNSGASMISPTSSNFNRNIPMQSPSSEYPQGFGGLPPMNPGNGFSTSPQYSRHQFPPANPADMNPPCNTLYVGNLPMDTLEEELKDLFSKQRGYKRLCFRTKHNGPMCFVEFEDVSFATKALHELYGSMLSNSLRSGIRLSFSKNPLGVRTGQANMHSPLTSPIGSGFAPPGFSTASGPPPGLSVPPGLSNSLPVNGMDGNAAPTNGSYYNHASPPQGSVSSSNAFHSQAMPASYMSNQRNGYSSSQQIGYPDVMPRR